MVKSALTRMLMPLSWAPPQALQQELADTTQQFQQEKERLEQELSHAQQQLEQQRSAWEARERQLQV